MKAKEDVNKKVLNIVRGSGGTGSIGSAQSKVYTIGNSIGNKKSLNMSYGVNDSSLIEMNSLAANQKQ